MFNICLSMVKRFLFVSRCTPKHTFEAVVQRHFYKKTVVSQEWVAQLVFKRENIPKVRIPKIEDKWRKHCVFQSFKQNLKMLLETVKNTLFSTRFLNFGDPNVWGIFPYEVSHRGCRCRQECACPYYLFQAAGLQVAGCDIMLYSVIHMGKCPKS